MNGSLETFYINNFAQGQKALGTFALTALGRNAQLRRCAGGWGNGGDPQKRQAWDNVPRAAFACSTRQMYSSTFLKVWRRTEPIIIVAVRESIRKTQFSSKSKKILKMLPFGAKNATVPPIILMKVNSKNRSKCVAPEIHRWGCTFSRFVSNTPAPKKQ